MASMSFGDRLDRWILKKGFGANWPLSTLRFIETRRAAAQPATLLASKNAAAKITAGSPWADFIPRDSGYKLFAADVFPGLDEVVAACEAVFRRHDSELTNSVNKVYFFNLLTLDDLEQYPVLLDFALSAPMTTAVTGYLRQVPRLNAIGVFYSSVNDTVAGSQMYHVDGDALAQVKCFVNAWDVSPGGGEFTFLPKQRTTETLRSRGLQKTISDTELATIVPISEQIRVFGPPGSGVLCDTSRCLHQGSRARERPRLLYQFQYVSRPDALVARASNKPVPGGHLLITRELLRRFKLTNPNAAMFVD
jgi:hypothetical protein